MDFFKYFHFGLKRKYKYLLFGVVVALLVFNLLSLFGYCATEVSGTVINGLAINSSNGTISNNSERSIIYYYLQKGHSYSLYNSATSSNRYYGFLDSLPVAGDVVSDLGSIPSRTTVTFIADKDVIVCGNYASSFTLYDNDNTGFSNTINSLLLVLTNLNFWNVFALSIPFVIVVITFCFGFWFVVRLINNLKG